MKQQYKKYGALLKEWRLRAGIKHQADLAKLIRTRQQSVSRWEAGTSRPRCKQISLIASVLDGDANELLRAAGYSVDSTLGQFSASATFDQPFPIDSLTPDSFERFCYYFLAKLYPDAAVNRAGGLGHRQNGLDIEAVFRDGAVHSFQCKRVSEFGPQKVHTAVAEHTKKAAKKVLLLSRVASPQARAAARRHQGWEIWDKEDVARHVRNLSKDEQRRLVDIFFRGQRLALLGETESGPWQTLEEFFQPFSNERGAFSHSWELVGKDEEAAEITRLLADENARIPIVVGAGGAGKSRVLKEVVLAYEAAHKGILVRFLSPTEEITAKSLEDLGGSQKLLIVDDAHDRSDLPSLFQYVAGPHAKTKLLLAVRPYGLDYVKMQAGRFALTDDSMCVVSLRPLDLSQAKALALQVLEKFGGSPDSAESIARLTRDCPLATVVGAQVLAKGMVHAELVKNEDLFRSTLLGKFQDVVAGEIGDKSDAEPIKKLLKVLALVQPFHADDASVVHIANAVEGIADYDVRRLMRRLTEAGVLFKRGGEYRISPDLLADYIIEDICVGQGAVSTGYAERVFDAAKGMHAENLLLNLGKLDWRRSDGNPSNSQLMDGMWQRLRPSQEYSDPHIRAVINVAYFQPSRALDFVEQLMREGRFLRDAPNIIKYAAHNFDYLDHACALLWELGRGDKRELNQHPEHAIRVLSEMCAIEPSKPVVYSETVVDFALSLLAHDDSWGHWYSPIDILKGILRADGHTMHSQGAELSITNFSVRYEAVASLRRKVIGAIIDLLSHPDIHRALLAAHCLQAALRYPMNVSGGARSLWDGEFVQTLEAVGNVFASRDIDPLVSIAACSAVSWHAYYEGGPTKSLAAHLIESMPKSLDFRTTVALVDGHGHKMRRIGDLHGENAWNKELDSLAKDLICAYPEGAALLAFLDRKLAHIEAHDEGERSSSFALVSKLINASSTFSRQMLEEAITNPDTEKRYFIGYALAKLMFDDHAAGLAMARRLLDAGSSGLHAAVGQAYGCLELTAERCGDEDIGLLREVLKSSDQRSVLSAAGALRGVMRINQRLALDLVLCVDLGKSAKVADDVFMSLAGDKMLSSDVLTDGDVDLILNQLIALPELEGYWIETFLSVVSKDHALQVAKLLKKRVERAASAQDWSYRPCNVGLHAHVPLRIRESEELESLFRDIIVWMKSRVGDQLFLARAIELFEAIFSPFDDRIVEMFQSWVDAGTGDDLVAITHLIRKATPDFVFVHRAFVMRLLERAKQHGKKLYDGAMTRMYCAATSGARSGLVGQPFPEDLKMKTEAEKALADIPRISAAYNVYAAIKEAAEENIRRALKSGETLEE